MEEHGMKDYYKVFSKVINPDMSTEAIRRALAEQKNIYGNLPLSGKIVEKGRLINHALEVFRSEESRQAYDRQLAESKQKPAAEPPDPRQKELEKWKAQAQEYLNSQKYDLAKSAIERALPLDADHSDWWLYQLAANIYASNKDYSTALRYSNEAIVLKPQMANLVFLKATIINLKAWSISQGSRFSSSEELREEYHKIRREALALYREALSMAEDQKEPKVQAAILGLWAKWLYFRPDQTDEGQARKDRLEGERLAKRALELDDNNNAHMVADACAKERASLEKWKQEARTRHDKEEWEQAFRAIEEALKHDVFQPDAELYSLAAEVYHDDLTYDTALVYADKTLALNPKDIDAHLVKASALKHLHPDKQIQIMALLQRAVEIAEEQKSKTKQLYTLGTAAWILYFRGRTDEERRKGVELAKRARELGKSEDAEDVLKNYEARKEAERKEAARREAERRAKEAERREAERKEAARKEAERREAERKEAERKKAERKEWTQRARTLRDNKEYGQAASAVQKALEYAADDAYLYWLAADIYFSLKKYDTALWYIDRALALRPKDVHDNTLKGMILGQKALTIANDSRFSSNSGLWKQYRDLRDQELTLFQKAVDLADEQKDTEKQAYALGQLAYALWFRFDRLNHDQVEEERGIGIEVAGMALQLGKSAAAEAVVEAPKALLKRWAESSQRSRMMLEESWQNYRSRKSKWWRFWHRRL